MYMLEEILNLGNFNIFVDGKNTQIPNIKEDVCELVSGCYLAPCMAMADDIQLGLARNHGAWLEITFDDVQTYKDFDFEKLLIAIYPKHDFLVMHRFVDEKYQGKSITVNLLYKTTQLFKNIQKIYKGLNNAK